MDGNTFLVGGAMLFAGMIAALTNFIFVPRFQPMLVRAGLTPGDSVTVCYVAGVILAFLMIFGLAFLIKV